MDTPEQQQQPPQEPAQEPAATDPLTTEGITAPAAEATQQPPEIGEQLAALQQEVQGIRSALPPEAEQPADLYGQLASILGEPGEIDQGTGYENPAAGQQPAQSEFDPVDEVVRERVAEAIKPIQQQVEYDRRTAQLNALAEQHTELRDRQVQEEIADRIAERYGDSEELLTHPGLVEDSLLAIKAARATATEVPAEQAANQGAQIETNAGAASQQAQVSPEDQIAQGIMQARSGGDAFT